MIRLMLAAPASGSGKTVMTCALLKALQSRGLNPCAFKCGPDYIDPMFHRAALGVDSRSLDLFLCGAERARTLFERACAGHGAAVCEGVMGFYDGLGGVSDRASTWHTADALKLPVLLVLRARGASLTLAAQIHGLRSFRENSRIVGVLLNECGEALFKALAPTLERESGVPVLGCLPPMEEARFESRHLGLYTAAEIDDLEPRLDALARALEEHTDMDRLLALCECGGPVTQAPVKPARAARVRIAVARDEAFCFTYAETLEELEAQGAEPVFFSPLRCGALPDQIGGLYLPGGYPELYARQLSDNGSMLRAVAKAVRGGLPTVAECGGFLYLGETLRDENGMPHRMTGVLPGEGADAGRLVRFGYVNLHADRDSLLFRRGERVAAHEFHHWDTTEPGDGLGVEKASGRRSWRGGYVNETLYASFPHLYFAGRPELAARFVEAAVRYEEQRKIM